MIVNFDSLLFAIDAAKSKRQLDAARMAAFNLTEIWLNADAITLEKHAEYCSEINAKYDAQLIELDSQFNLGDDCPIENHINPNCLVGGDV